MLRKRMHAGLSVSVFAWTLAVIPTSATATVHLWEFNELYSNADGTVQFVELFTTFANQQFSLGVTMRASQGTNSVDYVFPTNTPFPTNNHHLLLATAAFAALPGAVTPDFVLPDGFLFAPNGTVLLNVFLGPSFSYPALPTDGLLSVNGDLTIGTNSPTNYAGETGSINLSEPPSVPAVANWGLLAILLTIVLAAGVILPKRSQCFT